MPKLLPKIKSKKSLISNSTKSSISKSASDVDLKKLRECDIYVVHDSFRKNEIEFNYAQSYPHNNLLTLSSISGVKPALRSKSDCQLHEIDKTNHRQTIYDEEDYVVLNFPAAELNHISQSEGKVQKEIDFQTQTNENLSNNQSYPLGSDTLDTYVTLDFEKPSESTFDECDYEVPISCHAPLYMALDSELENLALPDRAPPEPPNKIQIEPSSKHEVGTVGDKADIARNSSKSSERVFRQNWKKEAVRDKKKMSEPTYPSQLSKETFLHSISGNSNASDGEENLSTRSPNINDEQELFFKPIPSFLQARIDAIEAAPQTKCEYRPRTIKSSSTTISSYLSEELKLSLENDFESDEWTDDSEFSSDYDSYYEQVSPPDLSGYTSDHDYAVITDLVHDKRTKKKGTRTKSLKKMMNFMNSRSKSIESSKSANEQADTTPKLHRQTMQDIKLSSESGYTWEAVSTPAVIKMDNFKELKGNNQDASNVTECSYRES